MNKRHMMRTNINTTRATILKVRKVTNTTKNSSVWSKAMHRLKALRKSLISLSKALRELMLFDKLDMRYTICESYMGQRVKVWAVYFCGDYIGNHKEKEKALKLAYDYESQRMSSYS